MWTLALALAAPLDDDAIQALLARDALLREPHEEACCGEGSILLAKVRWVELSGAAPKELVLTLQEYVGEGSIADHHHVYDVSGVEPAALGTIDHGGYEVFPYLEVTDLDADGIDELLAVGPGTEGSPSPFAIYGLVDGVIATLGATATAGQVYLPFDVDHDGRREVVALASYDDQVTVEVVGRDGAPAMAPPVDGWLPALFEQVLTTGLEHRISTTLELLSAAMRQRGLSPPHPERSYGAAVEQVATSDTPSAYAAATWWDGPAAQRARLAELLSDPERADAAAHLLLTSPSDRGPANAWLVSRIDAVARGEGSMPSRTVLAQLTAEERQRTCTHIQGQVLADGPEEGRGMLAHTGLTGPLWCVEATLTILGTDDLPDPVLAGAVHAVDRAVYDDEAHDAFRLRAPTLTPLLIDALGHPDGSLAGTAARALGRLGDHGDLLRQTLLTAVDSELQRSVLVALSEHAEPGPASGYLAVLRRSANQPVRDGLHRQLARMPDPADVLAGLSVVRDRSDYAAYHGRAVYRPETLSEPVRAVYRADAGARLTDADPRMRQRAAQVLGAVGVGAHGPTLRELAAHDDTTYVRSAAEEALGKE